MNEEEKNEGTYEAEVENEIEVERGGKWICTSCNYCFSYSVFLCTGCNRRRDEFWSMCIVLCRNGNHFLDKTCEITEKRGTCSGNWLYHICSVAFGCSYL